MEMENSRRPPFDRPRDLSIKKPRLAEEQTLASRQFQRSATQFRREEGALQQYMQHQELINQYKTALAELTFNSKPIITNLTIIAGENLQAAKAIAATICSNILEVPIEQKLPSLYLLDSIVKNIGRDYIKYFAARLPEVFCKVYRQANPSMHTSMQHLFKTWRVVFPPQMLQIIEKELGFQAVANGSSSGSATSKAESQSQRQQHSIHVNPKYLEARQRLQQPNRPQVTNIGGADVGSPERTASTATGRPWANPSVKMPTVRPQREALREAGHQKQGGGNYDIAASALARSSRTLVGKPTERLIGQDKRWPGASREVEESRMEYEKYGPSNYTGPRSAGVNVPSTQSPPRKRSNAEMSRSWKNSEEEEYLWDDLGNGITGPSDGLEKLEFGDCKAEVRSSFERETSADTLSSELKEQVADGHSRSSLWKMHEPYEVESSRPSLNQAGTHSVTGLSSEAVSSSGFQTAVSGTMGSMVQRQPSPGQSAMNRRSPSPSLSKRDPRQRFAGRGQTKSHSLGPSDPRTASLSGQVSVGLHDKSSQSAMPSKNQNLQSGLAGDSNVSSLLAAVVKSGFLSDSSVADHPSVGAPASASITKSPQNKAGKPPLPSGSSSSPSPVIDPSAQNSDMANANSNPLSSLFSSLLAKGLISKYEPTPSTSLQSVEEVKEESPVLASKPPVEVEPALKTSIASKEPTIDKLSSSELTGNKPDTSVQNMKDETETQNLIGYEFKPPVIRALHPEVIDRVTEEVPHKCNACGLRYKLKGQLDRHTEWHTFRNSIPSSLIRPSRRWYSSSTDWAAGKAGFPCGYKSTSLSQESGVMSEKNEQVIPADENQYVCLLCGELFEDFYTEERDEWMFKGAVYMSIPSKDNQTGPSDESGLQKLIVHAKCSSDDAVKCLGLGQWHSSGIKLV